MAADLLTVLKYANNINYMASTPATSAINSAAACETPRNPTLAANVPIDEEEAVTLVNCTHDMIGKEAMEKILHYFPRLHVLVLQAEQLMSGYQLELQLKAYQTSSTNHLFLGYIIITTPVVAPMSNMI